MAAWKETPQDAEWRFEWLRLLVARAAEAARVSRRARHVREPGEEERRGAGSGR